MRYTVESVKVILELGNHIYEAHIPVSELPGNFLSMNKEEQADFIHLAFERRKFYWVEFLSHVNKLQE